jgi:tetratricopeptide (TPR) repeat protein
MPRFEFPELSPDETRYGPEFERGSGLWAEKKYAEALRVFQGIEAKVPDCAAAQFCVGATLGACGKYAEAIAKLTKLIEAHPGTLVCFAYRAWVYLRQEAWESALQDLNVYIKARPGESWSVLWRGWCLLATSDIEKTMKEYAEKNAGNQEALEHFRLENANIEAALKDFETVLGARVWDLDALIGKALALALIGDRAGAREALWDLDDTEERSPWTAEQEIRVYECLRDTAAATTRARALVDRDPANLHSWIVLARVSGTYYAICEEGLGRNPASAGFHVWHALSFVGSDLDGAADEILKAKELDAAGFGFWWDWVLREAAREPVDGSAGLKSGLLVALATSRTGNPAGARTWLERPEFRNCRELELSWVRFRIAVDEGKFKEAVARLDEYLEKSPQILDRIRLIESHPALHAFAESPEYRDWKVPPGQK